MSTVTEQLDFATTASPARVTRRGEAGGGRRPTLGRKRELTWEGRRAAGVASCPLCGGRMERRAAHGRCGCCGTRLS